MIALLLALSVTPEVTIPVYEFDHPKEIRIKCEGVCEKDGKVFDGVKLQKIDAYSAAAKCVCKEKGASK